jgi:hypothetical protein
MGKDAIITALEEQVGCYRRLAKLAEVQHEYVQNGQTEELLEVLAKRQEVLQRITALEVTVGPARKAWTEYLAKQGAAERKSAEALMGEARDLLEEITASDRNDAMVLQQRKIEVARQMGAAGIGRQVNRSYAAAAYGSAGQSRVNVQK